MQENRVSIKIAAADLQKALDAAQVISDTLAPYLVALTADDRKSLPKMNDGNMPFVQKALDYGTTNAQFVPAFIDVSELKVDVDAIDALLQIHRPLFQLTQTFNDTMMLCGSEAYVAALAIYNNAKQAAKMNVPGAKAIADDLGARFAGQGKAKTTPASATKPA